ncbi:MAG: exopolyphosphatase [Alphaproteobacteria bacterium]|nr:exopolyphosphatase [Alphaproteobacteria bacterium]MBU0859035.1 exopolyphosphatase [Alphaproteobacteria bacterium]
MTPPADQKFRLITRSDMDGLVCAILLKEIGMIDQITFAHPKDMQDGIIEVGPRDITTNLPYNAGAGMCFDHHASELERNGGKRPENYIIDPSAPSAARVVYDYFGGKARFPRVSDEMMIAVDKADSADFTKEDILDAQGWELLSFIMDARTGLGRFRDFNISNYQLMMKLIDYCREHNDINDILELPDVKERVELYKQHQVKCRGQIESCAKLHGKLVVLDLRNEQTIYAGNRFLVYALFPNCNISIHVLWGKNQQNTVFATGKSILNRTSRTNVGHLMLQYGGGGHEAAGTCQVDNDRAEAALAEIIAHITKDG